MRGGAWLLAAVLIASCERTPPSRERTAGAGGRLETINGYLVLHIEGDPEAMGEQHGRLLKDKVKRVVADVIDSQTEYHPDLLRGAMKMEPFLPEDFRRELRALADAAEVAYEKIVALQLFGDVNRASFCTFFAAFDEATRTGEPIIGRNMDYDDYGVSEYGAVLIHFKPKNGLAFFTVSWAGVINGWTAMNEKGVVAANNTGYGTIENSMEGVSTCFMLRKVVQFADTVEKGIEIVKTTPRACGTILLIAGGHPPDAAAVEYDHKDLVVRRARGGVIVADNDFGLLHQKEPRKPDPQGTYRYDVLWNLIEKDRGKIDRNMNLIGAEGVPIESMNVHSALLFPRDLRFRVAMGKIPAFKQPYRKFHMTPKGIVSDE
ncbi:MAG: C45 family peptidase [Planctomycetota bacterium]